MAWSERGFGWKLFVTHSDSMRPFIFAGDMVLVRRTTGSGRRFGVGDVVACVPIDGDTSPVVRRIRQVTHTLSGEASYLTRCDALVASQDILGEVTATFPKIGRILHGQRGKSPFDLTRWAPAPNARKKLHSSGGSRAT
jgi:signal peptidase I